MDLSTVNNPRCDVVNRIVHGVLQTDIMALFFLLQRIAIVYCAHEGGASLILSIYNVHDILRFVKVLEVYVCRHLVLSLNLSR